MHMHPATAPLIALCATTALGSCTEPLDRVPPAEPFEVGDDTFVWNLAHGVVGGLSVYRVAGAGRSVPQVVMTCSDTARGALQIRDAAALSGPLAITAGAKRFTVTARPDERLSTPAGRGEGDFPDGWFDALASAPTVEVAFGGQTVTFKGPGPAAVRHFERYCRRLERRPKG